MKWEENAADWYVLTVRVAPGYWFIAHASREAGMNTFISYIYNTADNGQKYAWACPDSLSSLDEAKLLAVKELRAMLKTERFKLKILDYKLDDMEYFLKEGA